MVIDPVCPNCSSRTTQSVAMLIQQGTTTRTTTGVAAGATRKRGAAGVYGSSSTMRSALVARYTPGPRPGYGVAAVAIILGLGMIPAGFFGSPVVGVVGGVSLVLGIFLTVGVPAAQRKWDEQRQRLGALWICKKCGHEWTPDQT